MPTNNETEDWQSAISVDARGLSCPQPLLALRRKLREVAPGTLLRVLSTDPASQRDFRSYADLSGQPLLRVEQQGDEFSYWLRSRQPANQSS